MIEFSRLPDYECHALTNSEINEAGVNITTIDSPVELACELIEKSFSLETDIRATVEHLSWTNFSRQMNTILAESR